MTDPTQVTSTGLDLLLKGGHLIDPANGIDAPADVGISGNQIVRVADDIPTGSAGQVVDVSGHYVTPGILDIHTHVYTFRPPADSYVEGLNADAHLFSSGVTTTVDAGTTGWIHFPDFKAGCIDRARVRILAMVNIASGGMVNGASEQNVAELRPGDPPLIHLGVQVRIVVGNHIEPFPPVLVVSVVP